MNDKTDEVISFVREKNGDKVITIINLSNKEVNVNFDTTFDEGTYKNLFSDEDFKLDKKQNLVMKPWEYLILHN